MLVAVKVYGVPAVRLGTEQDVAGLVMVQVLRGAPTVVMVVVVGVGPKVGALIVTVAEPAPAVAAGAVGVGIQ